MTSEPRQAPASAAQRRIWLVDRLRRGIGTDLILSQTLSLRGALDVDAIRQAVQAIVARHEVLRTCFSEQDGEPVQVIGSFCPVPIAVVDLRGLDGTTQRTRVEEAVRGASLHPFDLSTGPLLRCVLLTLDDDRHVLSTHVHHIVWDAWSYAVWNRELGILYAAFRAGRPSPLPPLARQYTAFVESERHAAAAAEAHLAYWQDRLGGAADGELLPTDRPRPPMQSMRGARHVTAIPADMLHQVRSFGRARGMTLYMLLLGALGVVLARHSHEDDIVVGSAVANRPDESFAWLIGCFVNFLAIRMRVDPDAALDNVLALARTAVLDALTHQAVSFDRVVAAVAPVRRHDAPPLFRVVVALHNAPIVDATLGGLQIERVQRTDARLGYDLEIHAAEFDGGLAVEWRYNVDLFDDWRIAQLARHFERALQAMLNDPRQTVSSVRLLSEAETGEILRRWCAPADVPQHAADVAPARTLPALFERQVAATPDRVAVEFGDHALTYGQLNARANRVARALIRRGAGPEAFVAVALNRSIEMIVAVLGVLKAGAAYVPLALSHPAARIVYMVERSRPLLALCDPSGSPLPASLQSLAVDDALNEQAIANGDGDNVDDRERLAPLHPDHPAYLLFTSGSSGAPKAVVGTHHGLVNRLQWFTALDLEGADGPVLAKSSLVFVDGSTEMLEPLTSGRTIVLAERDKDPRALAALVMRHRVTQLTVVPSLLSVLLDEWEPREARTCRLWLSSGEPLPPALARRFAAAYDDGALLNFYGMTEAAGDSLWGVAGDGLADLVHVVWGTQVFVLDRLMQPVPWGVSGEIYIGGDGLARGYRGDPGATAARFVPNPYGRAGTRLYRTGDLACGRPDGRLQLLGRADDQVKIAGVRTSPAEAEAALLALGGIAAAAVVPRKDRTPPILVAYVVPAGSGRFDVATARRSLREIVPAHMVPSVIVALEELPRTATGKVDRQTLARQPLPRQQETADRPQTAEERVLCEIFSELFRTDRVGRFSNFFELGGHSLQAIQLANRVSRALRIELDGMAVFDTPIIAELAQQLERLKS